MQAFTTTARVTAYLAGQDATGPLPAADVLAGAVGAVNAWLSGIPWTDPASPAHQHAATMLTARLWRRRNSPSGIESVTDAGVAYSARTDPDVARLLGLDAYAHPQVG